MAATPTPPSRRFLHICYCCDDTDAVVGFYERAFGLKETMRNPLHPSDGSLLGIDGEIVSGAAFVYDWRGPRVSPSVEVQEWVSPKMIDEPIADPTRVGMQALGFAVDDVDAAVDRAVAEGAAIVWRGESPWGTPWATVSDPFGTRVDLVADAGSKDGAARMRHLRITVSDLETSLPWYAGMGFTEVDRHRLDGTDVLGTPNATADVIRLRLPDEAFEVLLYTWTTPTSHGRHPVPANTAGLYRTAVGVDDTRQSYDEFRAAGWTFEREPRQVELEGTAVPDMWICFLDDPDGVPFEFVQRPRGAFRPDPTGL
jgi:catechol 2,3-dioxygenase-like lactoylglutathione lyase family enzyme